jgi:PTS system ascorbate-specific IIA component
MKALLIVAHEPLASALKAVAHHAFADCDIPVEAIDVDPQASVEKVAAATRAVLERLGRPDTLALVDVANATPSNGVLIVLREPGWRLRVVSGVNVPMLWRALCYRDRPLEDLPRYAIDGGLMGVLNLSGSHQQQQRPPRDATDDPNGDHDQ